MAYNLNFLNKNDSLKRYRFKKYERFSILTKSCFFDKRIFFTNRLILKTFLNKKYNLKYHSIVNVRNRCMHTGRSRFILKTFNLSRMSSKEFLSNGFFSGFIRK